MAKVLVTLKIMPASAETSLDKVETEIKARINPDRISREPIAFGLNAIIISTLIEDAEGEMDKIENAVRSIDGVGEIEVTEITRTI